MIPTTDDAVNLVLAILLLLALWVVLSCVVFLIVYKKYSFKTRMNGDIELEQISSANQELDRVNLING